MRRRRQPPLDVWVYFEQKEKEYAELSLEPDRHMEQMFAAEAGSGDQQGRIFGNLFLENDAFLAVHEVVVVDGNHVHRLEYSYFLVMDGREVWGYERDPTHDPPVHRHTGPDHVREGAEAISFNLRMSSSRRASSPRRGLTIEIRM